MSLDDFRSEFAPAPLVPVDPPYIDNTPPPSSKRRVLSMLLGGAAVLFLIVLFAFGLIFLGPGAFASGVVAPTPTLTTVPRPSVTTRATLAPIRTSTRVPVRSTATPRLSPTTMRPTSTPAQPTATPLSPTDTPVPPPPTNTPEPPTATPEPPPPTNPPVVQPPPPAPRPANTPVRQVYYTVRSGDSLYTIAVRHGTTVTALVRVNNLKTQSIYPGQVLLISR
jgi:LysM repeat protein